MALLAVVLAILFVFTPEYASAKKPVEQTPTTSEESLNECQDSVNDAAVKFIGEKVKAIGKCLQEISSEIIEYNYSDASMASSKCVDEFDKVLDLQELFISQIDGACNPESTLHTLDDILGTAGAAVVAEPINAVNISDFCTNFGGDGDINSLEEWIDCMVAAIECAADEAIAVQYPRVLEWLALVRDDMEASPSSTDAVTVLDALFLAIDGQPSGDLKPDICCGYCEKGPPTEPSPEICDGLDND
jgi:hypothetical protein